MENSSISNREHDFLKNFVTAHKSVDVSVTVSRGFFGGKKYTLDISNTGDNKELASLKKLTQKEASSVFNKLIALEGNESNKTALTHLSKRISHQGLGSKIKKSVSENFSKVFSSNNPKSSHMTEERRNTPLPPIPTAHHK